MVSTCILSKLFKKSVYGRIYEMIQVYIKSFQSFQEDSKKLKVKMYLIQLTGNCVKVQDIMSTITTNAMQ